jgi:hypothetical protein
MAAVSPAVTAAAAAKTSKKSSTVSSRKLKALGYAEHATFNIEGT